MRADETTARAVIRKIVGLAELYDTFFYFTTIKMKHFADEG
jgi:hypothetical protein